MMDSEPELDPPRHPQASARSRLQPVVSSSSEEFPEEPVEPLDSAAQSAIIQELWANKISQDRICRIFLVMIALILQIPLFLTFQRSTQPSSIWFLNSALIFFTSFVAFQSIQSGREKISFDSPENSGKFQRLLARLPENPFSSAFSASCRRFSQNPLIFLIVSLIPFLYSALFHSAWSFPFPSSSLSSDSSFLSNSIELFHTSLLSHYFPPVMNFLYCFIVYSTIQQCQSLENNLIQLEKLQYSFHTA